MRDATVEKLTKGSQRKSSVQPIKYSARSRRRLILVWVFCVVQRLQNARLRKKSSKKGECVFFLV